MPTDSQLRLAVKPQLEPHEELLWVGHPNPNRMAFTLSKTLSLGICISLIVFSYVFYDEISYIVFAFTSPTSSSKEIELSVILIGLLIGCVTGLFLGPINLTYSYIRALKTTYALTNKRALIIISNLKHSIQSYSSADIGIIERVELKNGSGDLIFSQKCYKDSEGDWQKENVKFIGVQKVKFVEDLFRQVFNK